MLHLRMRTGRTGYVETTKFVEQSPSWKLLVPELVKTPHFMEPEDPAPWSQKPTTCPYPEQNESSPRLFISSVWILCSHLLLGLPSVTFPSDSPIKTLYISLHPTRATCPVRLILLIWSLVWYWVMSTKHEAPHYEVFSSHLLLFPRLKCLISTPFSIPLSPPVACVLPFMWDTKFHTHTEQWEKL